MTKGTQESDRVIFPTLEILLSYDPFGPCKFEITGTTCRYNVQELEILLWSWGESGILSVGWPSLWLGTLQQPLWRSGNDSHRVSELRSVCVLIKSTPEDINGIQQCQKVMEKVYRAFASLALPSTDVPVSFIQSSQDSLTQGGWGIFSLSTSCMYVLGPIEFFVETLFSWFSLHLSLGY